MAETDTKTQNDKVKNASKMAATQAHLRLSEIRDDVLVLKNGGLRAVLEVSAINFNLKSEQEQNAIIFSYQNFLNTLEYPLQIVIQSRKLDLDVYLDSIHEKISKHENELLKQQTEEYINFVKRLLEYADIMEKKFYVVVPYDPYRAQKQNFLQKFLQSLKGKETAADIAIKHKEFGGILKNLNQRLNVVVAGLEGIGLKVRQLSTKELIELFYKIYNPIVSKGEKLPDVTKTAIATDEEVIAAEQGINGEEGEEAGGEEGEE